MQGEPAPILRRVSLIVRRTRTGEGEAPKGGLEEEDAEYGPSHVEGL